MNNWIFPLKDYEYELPLIENGHKGSFSYPRKHHTHEGVDLYCKEGSEVFSVEDGEIIGIRQFTGKDVGSPWWNKTFAVFIQGVSGVVVYGEIIPNPKLVLGQKLKSGELIGKVTAVLKKEKGNPVTMLHLELYENRVDDAKEWKAGENKPAGLLDPTPYLKSAKENK